MVLTPPHHAREPPNLLVNIKGKTLVELYDDAYYFWHPGTETFMSEGCYGAATAKVTKVAKLTMAIIT